MSAPKYYNSKTIKEWSETCEISAKTIKNRLKEGWTIEEAITVPYGSKRNPGPYITNLAIENKIALKTLKKRMNAGMTIEEAIAYNYKKNYVGNRYGRLFVEKEIEQRRDPNGRARRQFLCLCDCGNETTALAEQLDAGTKLSCGCYQKELSSKRREKNLIGQTIGRWFIESEAFRDKNGIHWNAICVCGNRGTPTTNNLLSGTSLSCGCYNLEQISKREKAEIKGRKFGKLLAEECVGQNEYKNYLWRCLCDCGSRVIVPATRLLTGETQSCGCLTSRGEEAIANFLSQRNIFFTKGKCFEDLKCKSYLKFDFALLDQSKHVCLIEYQGIQHYEKQQSGFGDQQREITDKMKKDYCCSRCIPLFEIRYDEDIEQRLNEIIAQVNPVLNSDISEEV